MRGRSLRCNSLAKPNWFLDRFGLKGREPGSGLQIIDLNEIGEINDLCFQSRDVSLFGQPLIPSSFTLNMGTRLQPFGRDPNSTWTKFAAR
jgi:hypothetical protein